MDHDGQQATQELEPEKTANWTIDEMTIQDHALVQLASGRKMEELVGALLTCSVQRWSLYSMPVGAEEKPDQQTCQSHGQRCQVHLGCFGASKLGGRRERERECVWWVRPEKDKRMTVNL